MLALMCDENAAQKGSNTAAVLNEVEAVVKRLVGVLHENEHGQVQPGSFLRAVFDGRNSLALARQHLMNGDGVGERLIRRYWAWRRGELFAPKSADCRSYCSG